MNGEPKSPVAVVSVGAPGAQPKHGSSSIGAVGQLSTPELLAKRLQRQQAEREALVGLCSRPNLARRLLQPLQPTQQQHARGSAAVAAGPGSSTVNMLSRAAKRPLAPKPSAMEPEQPTGVSADELAKLLDGDAPAEDSPAKRMKLADLPPSMQQQQAHQPQHSPLCPAMPRLLSQRQQDPAASLAAASERVAAMRRDKQREQEAAAAAAAAAAATAAAAAAAAEAERKRQQQTQQHPGAAGAAGGSNDRWMYKPAGGVPAASMGSKEEEKRPGRSEQQIASESEKKGQAVQHANNRSSTTAAAKTHAAAKVAAAGKPAGARGQKARSTATGNSIPQQQEEEEDGKQQNTQGQKRQAGSRRGAAATKPPAAAAGKAAGNAVASQAQRTTPTAAGNAATPAAGPAAADGLHLMKPLQQLAAATLDAPSRRLQLLQAGAAAVPQDKPAAMPKVMPSSRGCVAIAPVMEQYKQQQQQQQRHQPQQQQQQQPRLSQQQSHDVPDGGSGHFHMALPSPLARCIAAAAAVGGSQAFCADNTEAATAAAAAGASVPAADEVDAAGGPGRVLLLDSDDDVEDLMELRMQGSPAEAAAAPAAPLPAAGGAAGQGDAAAASEPGSDAACQGDVLVSATAAQQQEQQPRRRRALPHSFGVPPATAPGSILPAAAVGFAETNRQESSGQEPAAAAAAAQSHSSDEDVEHAGGSSSEDEGEDGDGSSSSGWQTSDSEGLEVLTDEEGEPDGSEVERDGSDADMSEGEAGCSEGDEETAEAAGCSSSGSEDDRQPIARRARPSRAATMRLQPAADGTAAAADDADEEGWNKEEPAPARKRQLRRKPSAGAAGGGAAAGPRRRSQRLTRKPSAAAAVAGSGSEGDELDDMPLRRRIPAAKAAAAAAGAGSGSEADEVDDVPLRRRIPAAKAAAAAAGSCSEADDEDDLPIGRRKAAAAAGAAAAAAADGDGAPAGKGRGRKRAAGIQRRKRAAAAAGAEGGVDGEAAAGGVAARKAAKTAAGTAVKKPPRTKKTAHRQNFKRHTHNGGYGFKFMSKSVVHAGSRRFRRVTKSGKLIMARRQAPHMAGQGAEFVDGFAGGASGGGTSGKGRCFKCGQAGHWAADCPLIAASIAAQEAEMAEWRTAQDEKEAGSVAPATAGSAAEAATKAAAAGKQDGIVLQDALGGVWMPQQQPASYNGYREQQAAAAAAAGQAPAQPQQPVWPLPLSEAELKALAGVAADAPWQPELLSEEQLQGVLRGVWGHQGFRGQQLPLVRAALQGRSMLGVLPTGLGKSLTYQLPALLLQGLVVVVSPLLALMRDQLERLPKGLPGAMLQGSMSRQEVEQVLGRAAAGQLRLLYVAPEKLSARPVMECLRGLSPLPLVCVDEAHCMAEWGQGFRPAYFRLGHLLCNVLRPRAVLALTATATPVTRACIRQLLAIPPEQQLIESPLRSNLRLQVAHFNGASKGGGIAAKVVQLLTTGELASAKSVVVYAGFKAAANSLAAQLQRAQVTARPYHAGLTMQQREAVQAAFLTGSICVVVATVAFGMGVDKQDLDAVLHTCLPHSLEEYVQQVGRAGRDGRVGRCMLFLDDADYVKLRALAHGGTARRCSIELFLARVFGREAEYEAQQAADAEADVKKRRKQPKLDPSRHRALPVQAAAAELDLGEEVMEGCLSFLQADAVEPYITALPNTAATIDVRFHKTPPEQLAEHHPVVAAIIKAKCRKYAGTYKVHMPALLAAADRPPGELLSELAALAAAHEVGLDLGREGALVWRLERQPADWQGLVADMAARLEQVRHATVCRLDRCYTALAGAAVYSSQAAQERHMRAVINEYFMDEPAAATDQQQQHTSAGAAADAAHDAPAAAGGANAAALAAELGAAAMVEYMQSGEMPWGGVCPIQRPSKESLGRQMRAALRSVWARAQDLGRAKFTGLALARLLAGLASPAVPASTWKGSSEWGRLAAVDFRLLVEVGEQVVAEYWEQHTASQAQTAQLMRQ